ncbi:MAG: hypothetical protein M3R24_20025 [Chloroflexota bacterium]|nr:hypothetical protein [Chloroflexota bacterium]
MPAWLPADICAVTHRSCRAGGLLSHVAGAAPARQVPPRLYQDPAEIGVVLLKDLPEELIPLAVAVKLDLDVTVTN